MDDRVYEIQVCPTCFGQVAPDTLGDVFCEACGALVREPTTVRFRVQRAQLLKQAAPRQSLIERSLYFGCIGDAGHYFWKWPGDISVYSGNGKELQPWGLHVDGGLIPKGTRLTEGEAHVLHKDGWTALVFEDRSVDSRGGSWSVFLFPDTLDGPDALALAREAWPQVFARYGFEVKLA